MLLVSFILLQLATLLSGLWFLVAFIGWFTANVVISLGYHQYVGPSAHNKRMLEQFLRAKMDFEIFWVGGLCRFLFCAIVTYSLYLRIWGRG